MQHDHVAPLLASIRREFADRVDPTLIDAELNRALEYYSDARITAFVPTFVERRVRDRLRAAT